MRTTLLIQNARENNLKNLCVELPRDQLVVITGVSGSGKSSLAFDTIYAEGQRRLLESMSSYAKRFIQQVKKPEVDLVAGLSPVISIEQKTISGNPRSTVGTLTDIHDYLRMLYATLGQPHCPLCEEPVPVWSPRQMVEHLLALPEGTEVEARAPVLKIYGEDYPFLFEHIRSHGYRRARVDGVEHDLGEEIPLDEDQPHVVEAIIERFVIQRAREKEILTALEDGVKIGEGFFSFHPKLPAAKRKQFERGFGCAQHRVVAATQHPGWFTFNDPAGACVTCSGLGVYLHPHPTLLVPDPSRSLRDGAFAKEVFQYDKNTWSGRLMHSLAVHYGFDLDTPFQDLPKKVVDMLFHGTQGESFPIEMPPGGTQGDQHIGKSITFQGFINQLERQYRWYRAQGESREWMEDLLRKVMVEYDCPDCGGTRLKRQRQLVRINGIHLHQLGEMPLPEALAFLEALDPEEKHREVGETILREVTERLRLLIGIGLDYLNLNRRSATLSGGEAQRIRLSSQIGSGLMGMLYVLDEPSIGLHPKDNVKMIQTLRRLRDLGNTVIVVEHDEDTLRAADHLVEIGPGPGIHGGQLVAQGTLEDLIADPASLTGQFLSGQRKIPLPATRRELTGPCLRIEGASENNLRNLDLEIPLGGLTCVTGASGSGKSTLVHEILYQKLYALMHDSRVLPGKHRAFHGREHLSDVINIDQSPIGRTSRSNPATYVGFYDNIRKLFASVAESQKRGYTASRFSFNVKGGRCEECGGEGSITTQLSFMPDVKTTCPACKGRRYNPETLEIQWNEKNIAEVLEMSIEAGTTLFEQEKLIARKLKVLDELGLGYLQIGHPSPLLSGGEAQRVKLATELSKLKRGKHNLYILDEPTTGLHLADIQKLLDSLNSLVDGGHTVLVIEHHLDVIKTADWVLDLGPEGGHKGGQLLVAGTPETVAACEDSITGRYLRAVLVSA